MPTPLLPFFSCVPRRGLTASEHSTCSTTLGVIRIFDFSPTRLDLLFLAIGLQTVSTSGSYEGTGEPTLTSRAGTKVGGLSSSIDFQTISMFRETKLLANQTHVEPVQVRHQVRHRVGWGEGKMRRSNSRPLTRVFNIYVSRHMFVQLNISGRS